MNLHDIEAITANHESRLIEYKQSIAELDKLGKAICGFLNIVNALIHRDYSDPSGDISLFIFNTHLEIHNIGHLYADMTISKLKKRHTSRQRNP